jgi:signal transduction histidine kinase
MARSWNLRPLGAVSDAEPDQALEGVRQSLARQSLLVGLIAAAVDVTYFLISGIYSDTPVLATAVAVLVAAADVALAAPPSTVAVVAVAQVATRLVAVWLLYSHGRAAGFGGIGMLVAGYRAGAWLSIRASLLIVPLLVGALTWTAILNAAGERDRRLLLIIVVSNGIVPWLVGRYTAAGGAYVTELEQRDRLRRQEHRVAMDKALTQEREAMARDLHDVISHHVSAIGIHAGVARMALAHSETDGHPQVATSLSAVESSSRAAMLDLRRQLDLLHGNHDAGDRQPGLANIDELIDSVAKAGLTVELLVPTDAAVLPPSLDITVFRIVQELLTNALRHGDGTASLEVRHQGDRLVIVQSNPIAAQPYSGGSLRHGLDGIRHRAELFGGTLECGSDDTRHWRAVVSLPIATP